ncbi:putative transcription factor interactor and regulator CCHC(Zn) family [Helianthus anomalus]
MFELQKLKTNCFLLADCRGLVQLFCYRCLQMWSADCRSFTSGKQTTPKYILTK